jgi:uncharacterized protein (TIGR02466 family)|tara:strand:+ start:177 stop:773 length:597 start_codon:yes stop_codon:yes gene_type:complete
MKGTLANLYPTPIYWVEKVDNFDEIQSEITTAVKEVEFGMKGDWGATHFLSDPTFKDNFIIKNDLNFLRDQIVYHLDHYMKAIGFPHTNGYIGSSWISLFKKGNYGHCHHHGTSDVSGVYYYKTDGSDGNIYFENPTPAMTSSFCYKGLCEREQIVPSNGLLAFFPGWLMHGITTNQTNHDRMSLSFNIVFDRNESNY